LHGRSLIKKVGKITEYSVTRTRIGPWPIFFLGRLHARVGQTLASSATSFPPTKSFHQLPSVPKERTHHARSLKSCARPERVGSGGARWRCAHALSIVYSYTHLWRATRRSLCNLPAVSIAWSSLDLLRLSVCL